MRAKVLTLRFSPQLGRFDDAPLVALQQTVVLERVREHLVQVGEEPMLVCIAAWRERGGAPPPPPPPPPPPTARPAAAAGATADATTAPMPPPLPLPSPTPSHGPAAPLGALRADFTLDQQRLHDALRSFRRNRAYAEGVPPYVLLTNRQLVDLALHRPRSRRELGELPGFGEKKLARLGGDLLQVLWPGDAAAATTPDAAGAAGEAPIGGSSDTAADGQHETQP
ncbi:MAG: HRDC domain-containing protein [Phycisphaerales bacterium]|jgi:hypothetical protein|nr:HRDC domain-containing protein [Phycisphaerales bacterium]